METQPKHLSPVVSWGIIGIVIIIIFGAIGWFYWQSIKETTASTTTATTSNSSTTTSQTTAASTSKNISASTIADWQKYTSPNYGYSIDFPKTWSWNGTDPKVVTFDSPENAKLVANPPANAEGIMHDIYIYYYPSVAQEEENVSNKYGATTLDEFLAADKLVSDVANATLGGVAAKEAVRGGLGAYYTVFAVKNNHLYEVQFGNAEKKADLSGVESQVLSTFQFTP